MDATRELETLWIEVFGEPPLIRAEAELLAGVLVSALPSAPPYQLTVLTRPGEDRHACAADALRDRSRRL